MRNDEDGGWRAGPVWCGWAKAKMDGTRRCHWIAEGSTYPTGAGTRLVCLAVAQAHSMPCKGRFVTFHYSTRTINRCSSRGWKHRKWSSPVGAWGGGGGMPTATQRGTGRRCAAACRGQQRLSPCFSGRYRPVTGPSPWDACSSLRPWKAAEEGSWRRLCT